MKTLKIIIVLLLLAASSSSLWATNPDLIKNILGITDSSYNRLYTTAVKDNVMYFSLQSNNYTGNLYQTDGTEGGTQEVKNVPSVVVGLSNGTIFFNGYDATNGWQLWKSDGSSSGTVMVKKLHTGTDVWRNWEYTYCNNYTYFYSRCDGTPKSGATFELWKTNGTSSGTTLLKSYPWGCQYLTDLNGTLLFMAHDGTNKSQHGHELWKSDGTARGTVLLKDIYPGPTNCREPNAEPPASSQYKGIAWYNAYTLLKVENYVYFAANDGTNGLELWRTDGTANGTVRLTNINSISRGDSYCYNITKMGGYLYFAATDGSTGMELWRYSMTDGTANKVKEINSSADSDPMFLTVVNILGQDWLFFVANDGNGAELWKSDGTSAGTSMVKNINTGGSFINASYFPTYSSGFWGGSNEWGYDPKFLVIGSKIYFRAYTAEEGMELWESDGTEEHTFSVKDLFTGKNGSSIPNSSFPKFLTNVGGNVIFMAYTPAYGWEWWKYDPSGTIGRYGEQDEFNIDLNENSINVYPNPASDQLNINANFGSKINIDIKVCDILGRILIGLQRDAVNQLSETIDISNLQPGMYLIDIIYGGEAIQKKIIKR
jgi:trimeric autotransporter adhesin